MLLFDNLLSKCYHVILNLHIVTEQLVINGEEKDVDCGQLTFFPALLESVGSEDLLDVCVERKIILEEFTDDEKVPCCCCCGKFTQHHLLLWNFVLKNRRKSGAEKRNKKTVQTVL